MGLVKCSKCGKEVPDTSAFCPNCGLQFKPINNVTVGKKPKKKIWLWVLIAIVVIGVIGSMGKNGESSDSKNNTTVQSKEESKPIFESSSEESSKESILSKDQLIALAEEVPYKTLARSPEEYKDTYIILTVKVQQIVQGGLFDSNEYYRVYTNDSVDMWYGDEYFMYDSRIDDNTKILQDDIIKVYAKFLGTQTVTRALTNTKEDVPAFEALYIELYEEEPLISDEVLNDGTIDVTFEDFSIKYLSYEISKDYDDKKCIILYFDYTNNSLEATSAMSDTSIKVYQNGVQCDSAFIFDENEALSNYSKEVISGTTIKVGKAFTITSNDDLLVEVSESFSFKDAKDTMSLVIK